MTQITIDMPDEIPLAEKGHAARVARHMLLLAAVKLNELGRLTSGRAVQHAGLLRAAFVLTLERCGVFPSAADLNEMEQNGAHGNPPPTVGGSSFPNRT